MESSNHTTIEATRYLLGAATVEEQAALEERYFSDPNFFEQVVAVEKDLLDDYARGRLSPEDRERFDRHYLAHPKRRGRAMAAQALVLRLDPSPSSVAASNTSFWRDLFTIKRSWSLSFGLNPAIIMAIALLLFIFGGSWLLLERRRLRSELDQTRILQAANEQKEQQLRRELQEQQARNAQLASDLEKLRAAQQESTTTFGASLVSLFLTTGVVRDEAQGDPPRLVISPGVTQARLKLKLKENQYPRYRLSVETTDGRIIQTQEYRSPNSANILTITIPSRRFTNGEYVLLLIGVTKNGESDSLSKSLFRVEKTLK